MDNYNTREVVMLQASNTPFAGQIYKWDTTPPEVDGLLGIFNEFGVANPSPRAIPQHLYILSDDKIGIGDYWVYLIPEKWNIEQGNDIVKSTLSEDWFARLWDRKNYKKVIASTDQTLQIEDPLAKKSAGGDNWLMNIPEIPQSFIDYFIVETNAGRKVPRVEVKYENYNEDDPFDFHLYSRLVVDLDNCISIKPSKEKTE